MIRTGSTDVSLVPACFELAAIRSEPVLPEPGEGKGPAIFPVAHRASKPLPASGGAALARLPGGFLGALLLGRLQLLGGFGKLGAIIPDLVDEGARLRGADAVLPGEIRQLIAFALRNLRAIGFA